MTIVNSNNHSLQSIRVNEIIGVILRHSVVSCDVLSILMRKADEDASIIHKQQDCHELLLAYVIEFSVVLYVHHEAR